MNLYQLLLVACRLSLQAGEEILDVYKTKFEVDLKDDNSPLTLADQRSHDVIFEGLSKLGYPVMSEEGIETDFSSREKWLRYWCVDPLDGTREFVKRNGEFTVNIALIENNTPILGVIYIPVQDLLYAATEGKAYQLNAASVHFQDEEVDLKKFIIITEMRRSDSDPLKVLVSRSHLSKETKDYLDDLGTKYSQLEYLSAGSALKFGLLAEGKADLYPRFSPCMEWDTAAGHAILKSVGKNIYSYPSGSELTYNKINLLNDWFIAR